MGWGGVVFVLFAHSLLSFHEQKFTWTKALQVLRTSVSLST